FENGLEQNNSATGSPLLIELPPHPDLISRKITISDTLIAGDAFPFSYEAFNSGNAKPWHLSTDSIYLSFSPVWDPSLAIGRGRFSHNVILDQGDSLAASLYLSIPPSQSSNVYYFYIKSDVDGKVYEHQGELNNIVRSDPVLILPPLPIDVL